MDQVNTIDSSEASTPSRKKQYAFLKWDPTEHREMAEQYWHRLADDDLNLWAFPEGDIKDFGDFVVDILQDRSSITFFMYDLEDNEVAGHFQLTGWQGLVAHAHFNILRKWHGKEALNMCRQAHSWAFECKREDGKTPWVETIVGITPVTNRAALLFVKRLGYKTVLTLPHSYWYYTGNEFVDGIVTTIDKTTLRL